MVIQQEAGESIGLVGSLVHEGNLDGGSVVWGATRSVVTLR